MSRGEGAIGWRDGGFRRGFTDEARRRAGCAVIRCDREELLAGFDRLPLASDRARAVWVQCLLAFRCADLGRGRYRRLRVLLGFRPGFRTAVIAMVMAIAVSVGRSGAGTAPGIVGYIPAGALELDGRRRNHLVDRRTALGACARRRIGEPLEPFKSVTAFRAFKLVKWQR